MTAAPQPAPFVSMVRAQHASFGAVELDGRSLALGAVRAVARDDVPARLTHLPGLRRRMDECFAWMMADVGAGVPVYGCNSGYGAQASVVLNDGEEPDRFAMAARVSRAISIVDVGVGPALPRDVVRAGILIRANMLLHGVSAVRYEDVELLTRLLNSGLTPVVAQYGGLGASGDLSHNARVFSCLRRLPGAKVTTPDGTVRPAATALAGAGIPAFDPPPKAGLGFTNGDNFSTGVATLLLSDAADALLASLALSAWTVEVLRGSDRSTHPLLAAVRPHPGQLESSRLLRFLLDGSELAARELAGHRPRPAGVSIQDGYSLRGVAQFHAVNLEKLVAAGKTLTVNLNSVSDNPLWVPPEHATAGEEPWGWVSGANFLAAPPAEILDGLRKTLTQIVKLADRHLARLVSPHLNNGLPANLSDAESVTGCAFKGVQIQAGMFEVYATLLANPVTTLFGVHEEGNQDITTHAMTSGIVGFELLRVTRYALAQQMLALAQATDLRGGPHLLAPASEKLYRFVRARAEYVAEERPLCHDIEAVAAGFESGELGRVLRDDVLEGFA